MVHMAILDPDMPDVVAARAAHQARYLEYVRASRLGQAPTESDDDTVTIADYQTGQQYLRALGEFASGGGGGGGGNGDLTFSIALSGFWDESNDHVVVPAEFGTWVATTPQSGNEDTLVLNDASLVGLTPGDRMLVTIIQSSGYTVAKADGSTLILLGEDMTVPAGATVELTYLDNSLVNMVSVSVLGQSPSPVPEIVTKTGSVDFDILHQTEPVIHISNPDAAITATLGVLGDSKAWEVTVIVGPASDGVTIGVVEGFLLDGVIDGTLALTSNDVATFIATSGGGWYTKSLHTAA